MTRRDYTGAVIAFLAIAAVVMLFGMTAAAINPEIAIGTRAYHIVFRLLQWTRGAIMLSMLLAIVGLWFLTCLLLLRSKSRSYAWSALAVFGPFGLVPLTMLRNKTPDHLSAYDRFVQAMNRPLRFLYEAALFAAICITADRVIEWKGALIIRYQAWTSGRSIDEIIVEHDASGGMWAFSEGMETIYLFMLLYLVWPLCFDIAARLPGWWAASKNA